MGKTTIESEKTGGQARRSADSRPRPGTDIPEAKPKGGSVRTSREEASTGERKPSESWSPIDPGRPTQDD